jgi:hypothetical protein
MDNTIGSDYPRLCIEVGLACETCVETTAQDLARVCKGLRGKMIGQMFVQIHPHSACSRMHAHFAEAYGAANRQENDEPEVIPRRGPQPERRRVMIAVA